MNANTTAETTLVQKLAELCASVRYEDLPDDVTRSARERALDIAGLILAAQRLETSAMARQVARSWGGPEQSTLLGWGERGPAVAAAFLNGTLAHSLDFDDTHLPSVLHPSASVVPGLWAAAEETGAGTHDLIAAAAGAYEVCIRTGMAAYDRELGNSVFFERGWHATSICGTLAVAAGAARLYGLGADGITHAMGIAASMGAGIIEGNRSGGSVKRLHCGWAAHAGLVAAQCAREGFTGPLTVFEGRFGFYEAFCGGTLIEEEISAGLGTEWALPGVFYKPYPANHFTHAGIDCARRLRERVAADEVESIELIVSTPTLRTIAEPRTQKVKPQSGYHAQFSGPFTVAAAWLGEGHGLGVYFPDFTDENVRDDRYLDLASKVVVSSSQECDDIFPHQFPAILKVRTKDGREDEERTMANRGGPDNPLSVEELKIKFFANAGDDRRDQAEQLAARLLDASDRPVSEVLAGL